MFKNRIIIIFLISSYSVFAQVEPISERLNRNSLKARERAEKIKHGVSRTKREHITNVQAMGLYLDSAITEHQNLRKSIRKSRRDEVEKHHLNIDKFHLEAKKYYEAMTMELSKDKHNEWAIRDQANRIYSSLEKAEKEQEVIKEKAITKK